ncbi:MULTISPECIES: DUF2624 family protein [Bacillaceae]|uniref:tRNA methyltransferase n=1 Tax=Peribacillus huizhouensis TaxID=1501239 RepID=A0ABR6CKC4_9BACI|nr:MULTISPECIES: DUF2624 family protein [Bacillaceae]MBA9025443.1 hypothetical protein [Peribacillus huizhouensis]
MKLFETMINHKINKIKAHELQSIASQHGVRLTQNEANNISKILAGRNINVFNPSERQLVLNEIAEIAGTKTANQIARLFTQLTANF